MAPQLSNIVVGGVDTHKELHVAAVVDERDRVLDTEFFPTTRHGYKQLVHWLRGSPTLSGVS